MKKINAKKGDVILSNGYPLAYEAFKVIGGYWGHCGMVMDDEGTTIRHCNFHIENVNIIYHEILGLKIFPKKLDPNSLSNGLPGFITQSIEEAFYSKNPDFYLENGFVLKPKPQKEEEYRPFLHEIADKMANLDGYYRINAYTNLFQQDNSDIRIKFHGTICSGAIYFAHKFCEKELNLVEVPAERIRQGAKNLFNYLWVMYKQKLGLLGASLLKITEIGKKMANQIINTYLADRSNDTSDWWKENLKSTVVFGPDHLLPKDIPNPDGNTVGVQDENSSYYGEIIPIKISEL